MTMTHDLNLEISLAGIALMLFFLMFARGSNVASEFHIFFSVDSRTQVAVDIKTFNSFHINLSHILFLFINYIYLEFDQVP